MAGFPAAAPQSDGADHPPSARFSFSDGEERVVRTNDGYVLVSRFQTKMTVGAKRMTVRSVVPLLFSQLNSALY